MVKVLHFAAMLAVFVTAEMEGRGQGAPRAQPVQPGGSGQVPIGLVEHQMVGVDPDKKFSTGDQVMVEIVEDREGRLPRVVTAAGDLDVPFLGRVHVVGKTPMEASAEIKRRLEAEYYNHATVLISIDVRSGIVHLSGEVQVHGAQGMIAGEALTLSNAILKAGGFTIWGNQRNVKVVRSVDGASETQVYDVKRIIETGDINADPKLHDGDLIFVPRVWVSR